MCSSWVSLTVSVRTSVLLNVHTDLAPSTLILHSRACPVTLARPVQRVQAASTTGTIWDRHRMSYCGTFLVSVRLLGSFLVDEGTRGSGGSAFLDGYRLREVLQADRISKLHCLSAPSS